MATETYKRIKRNRLKRKRRERLIKFIVLGVLCVFILGITINRLTDKTNKSEETTKRQEETTKKVSATVEEKDSESNVDKEEIENNIPAVIRPVKSEAYEKITSENVRCPYTILVDVNNHEVIAGKRYDKKIFPASMTKVMTLIVAVEHINDLDDTFEMTAEIIDPLYREEASLAGFAPGELVTAKDMLYGLILPSGADAAVGLAMLVSGSEEKFVDLMNEKCEELGLTNTHFMNTSGLYHDEHYTTPLEMAMIMEYAMQNELCAEILSTYQYTTNKSPQNPEGLLLTSTMFSRMYGNEVDTVTIKAGKTGYVGEAGSCLVSYAERGNDKYIAVSAKASGRWHVVFDAFELYGNYIPNPPGYTKE
ncbi:MAG: D-alanyl-D-alanine carboxypeptidase [Lachnospiraceae bacterium]|nr:D-alanyl-D-alanine carboxypeptidase [Lachnospiraceae bacterium]